MTEKGRRFRANALDLRHPFFNSLWRRIVLVCLLAVWAVIEILYGNPYWALLAGGLGAYVAYVFFAVSDPSKPDGTE